jgi:hypothetical protein
VQANEHGGVTLGVAQEAAAGLEAQEERSAVEPRCASDDGRDLLQGKKSTYT